MEFWSSLYPYRFSYFFTAEHPQRQAFISLYRKYRSKYGRPLRGTTRLTFLDTDWVYKIPLSERGVDCNYSELTQYMTGDNDSIPMAPCELLYVTPQGWPIIRMERVEHADIPDCEEGWWDWVDCRQVGYTRSGILVAYDYA